LSDPIERAECRSSDRPARRTADSAPSSQPAAWPRQCSGACASAADARPVESVYTMLDPSGAMVAWVASCATPGSSSPPTGNCHSTTRCRPGLGAGRDAAQPNRASTRSGAPPAPPRRPPEPAPPRPRGDRTPDLRASVRPCVRASGFPRASANSAALANRSAGSSASAHSTAASTFGGWSCAATSASAGSSVITRAMIACAVAPVNGGSAVQHLVQHAAEARSCPPSRDLPLAHRLLGGSCSAASERHPRLGQRVPPSDFAAARRDAESATIACPRGAGCSPA